MKKFFIVIWIFLILLFGYSYYNSYNMFLATCNSFPNEKEYNIWYKNNEMIIKEIEKIAISTNSIEKCDWKMWFEIHYLGINERNKIKKIIWNIRLFNWVPYKFVNM